MRYLGGKEMIADWVVGNILPLCRGRTRYVETCVGSGAIFKRLAPYFDEAVAGDIHPDLILMWQAVAKGWDPPKWVSRETYAKLRRASPSPLRGLVGFGMSFGGRWFAGYVGARDKTRNVSVSLQEARRSVLAAAAAFQKAEIVCCDFSKHRVDRNTVVYSDIPYRGTKEYTGTRPFDHARFWRTASQWARDGAIVVVSEESAPMGWRVLAERTRKMMICRSAGEPKPDRTERLFVLDRDS